MMMLAYKLIPHWSSQLAIGVAGFATLFTLWLRGNVWNYMIIVALETFVAVLTSLAFVATAMILEQMLHDKLHQVGEKVRAHLECLVAFYANRWCWSFSHLVWENISFGGNSLK
jgi:hypothetical protein